jgi:hypothetical protein
MQKCTADSFVLIKIFFFIFSRTIGTVPVPTQKQRKNRIKHVRICKGGNYGTVSGSRAYITLPRSKVRSSARHPGGCFIGEVVCIVKAKSLNISLFDHSLPLFVFLRCKVDPIHKLLQVPHISFSGLHSFLRGIIRRHSSSIFPSSNSLKLSL